MKPLRLGSLLVLTEDSGRDGHATIVAIVKRMLQLVVPDYQTHRLGFEPKNEDAQRAVRGTGWKRDPQPDDVRLALRTIATALGRDDGYVLFHVDGDRPWRDRALSENRQKFDVRVRARVGQALMNRRPKPTKEDTEARLQRLFLLMPFYSVEAWLYQHTAVAVRICHEKYDARDIDTFERWQRDRAALDDVEKPKESVCLAATHNLECAGPGYPAEDVLAAGRSYADCVAQLRANDELRALLEKTKEL